jgi:hypothetical protein
MTDAVIAVAVLVGLLIGLPIVLLVILDKLTLPSKKGLQENSRRFVERLQAPDFPAVEKELGRPLPACVQALYANPEELLRGDFEVAAGSDAEPDRRWYVGFYRPADGESARASWAGLGKYFAFADDGCGNPYVIDPKDDDPAVLFFDHETGEFSPVCDHFSEFMSWARFEIKE